MDLEPALKSAVLRVRDILIDFAGRKGWPHEDYRIFIKFNIVWGNFVVSFVARAFDARWPKESGIYDELMDHLEVELQDDRGLYESISVLIYQFEDYVFNIIERPFENYIDINPRMLNPDVDCIRPVASVSQKGSD